METYDSFIDLKNNCTLSFWVKSFTSFYEYILKVSYHYCSALLSSPPSFSAESFSPFSSLSFYISASSFSTYSCSSERVFQSILRCSLSLVLSPPWINSISLLETIFTYLVNWSYLNFTSSYLTYYVNASKILWKNFRILFGFLLMVFLFSELSMPSESRIFSLRSSLSLSRSLIADLNSW